jgi:predicted membrane-bound mannosyltransferase
MVSIGKGLGTTPPIDMNFSYLSTIWDLVRASTFYEAIRYIGPLAAAAIIIGMLWRPKQWPGLALLFLGIFAFFFTTVFTNPGGLFDGLVRYLGYWIVQHGEARASQPWFYYLLIQIPIYEYLPALGAIGAFLIALRRRLWTAAPDRPFQKAAAPESGDAQPVPTVSLFLFWALFSLAIFSYAGEKMPQQTMLIAAPLILAAAWAMGYLLELKASPAGIAERTWTIEIRRRRFEIPVQISQLERSILLAGF